jgi:hypothetical protein
MIKLIDMVLMPVLDPATPTVAAPLPINLVAMSMSQETILGSNSCLTTWSGVLLQKGCLEGAYGLLKRR